MKLKLALASATAMGLLTAAAWAGDTNKAFLDQSNSFNQATIDQDEGEDNEAGASGQSIKQVGAAASAQASKNNVLTITQSGDRNKVGLGTNANSFGHTVGVHQNQTYVGASTYASARNTIEVEQTSNDNTVGAVSQRTQTHAGDNRLVVRQGGAGGHIVGSVSQHRIQTTQNIAEIEQTGLNNTIARIEQYVESYGGTLGQDVNRIEMKMSGQNNGNGALTGAASVSGAQSAVLIQGKSGDSARLSYIKFDISGDNNQFGVTQYGVSNTVGTVTITGAGNQLGVHQDGTSNTLALSTISGGGNTLGLEQDGSANLATLNVDGDNNGGGTLALAAGTLASANGLVSGLVKQDGLNNNATLDIVSSSGNQFAFLQDGDNNVIDGDVSGAGANSATMVQIGNGNNSTFSQAGNGNMVAVNQ